jgi:hypothetical protein
MKIQKQLWILCLACIFLSFAQAQTLKPTQMEALVNIKIFLPDGSPLANEEFVILSRDARGRKFNLQTDAEGYVQVLLPKNTFYSIDFLGKARPKALNIPDKPLHISHIEIRLDRYQEGNAEITFEYVGMGNTNKTVLLKNNKGKTKEGSLNNEGIVVFWATANESYTIEIPMDTIVYPIYPRAQIQGVNLDDGVVNEVDLQTFKFYYTLSGKPTEIKNIDRKELIQKVVERNQWANHLIVFTGGWWNDNYEMYETYKIQLGKQANADKNIYVLASHCAICEKYDVKNIKNHPEAKLKHTGIANHDTESMLKSLKHSPLTKEMVLITTRNYITKEEKKEWTKLKIPIHIVVCGSALSTDYIHPDYVELAQKTKGSIHTLKADVSVFSQMKENQIVEIEGVKYQIKGKNFIILK